VESGRENLKSIARIISIVGHPFVLIPAAVLIGTLSRFSIERAFGIVLSTIFLTVAPILFVIRQQVRAGNWSDADVSIHSERKSFYPVVIGIAAFASVMFWLLNFPPSLLIGTVISLAMLVLAMLINSRSKISLHLTFAAFCAVSLFAVSSYIGAGFIILAMAVGWSRIALGRHTPAQVLSGILLGAAGGICLLKLIGIF
jgi:membrane-associated phospholipid phosphatase